MKPRTPRSEAGKATADRPADRAGWRGWTRPETFVNPRPPSVPATLDLRLEEYYAAAAVIGLLASQADEPDQQFVCDWSFKLGRKLAAEAMRRRKKR